MSVYVTDHTQHGNGLHSFCAQNNSFTGKLLVDHQGWEILFPNRVRPGSVEFDLRGKRHDLSQIKALVFNGREPHQEIYREPGQSCNALVFTDELIEETFGGLARASEFSFQEPVLERTATLEFIRAAFRVLRAGDLSLAETTTLGHVFVTELVDSLMHNHYYVKAGWAKERSGEILLKEVITLLHRHVADASYGLDRLSTELGVTKFHLIRTMKRFASTTPHAYLNRLRLILAKDRILKGSESIATIANDCGFEELSTFNKAFRRVYGTSPTQMRGLKAP